MRGAYALVILTPQGIIGAKDPWGIRPLCLGKLDKGYVLSSETCGLDAVGAHFVRELEPGEVIWISSDKYESARIPEASCPAMCVFEFIYFARPDSEIYGLNVHAARKALGKRLAQIKECDADLVTGVPDSSLSAASGYAEQAGIPYEMGLLKNRYIGRTFISPEQSMREFAVKIKLNPVKSLINGKKSSSCRGFYCKRDHIKYIIGLLRSVGAKEVHARISSPPYMFPCFTESIRLQKASYCFWQECGRGACVNWSGQSCVPRGSGLSGCGNVAGGFALHVLPGSTRWVKKRWCNHDQVV